MTYDERQEIEVYFEILRKDILRLSRGVDMMEAAINKMQCVTKEDECKNVSESAKEKFLKQY